MFESIRYFIGKLTNIGSSGINGSALPDGPLGAPAAAGTEIITEEEAREVT